MRVYLVVLVGLAVSLAELAPDPIVRPLHPSSHERTALDGGADDEDGELAHPHVHEHQAGGPPHTCVHDTILADALAASENHVGGSRALSVSGHQAYRFQPAAGVHGRRALSNNWAPIRIRTEFVDVTGPNRDPAMTDELASFLMDKLVPAAISRLTAMLSVRPVQGPLYAYRACTGYFTSTIPYRCAGLSADSTCGYLGAGDVPVVISAGYFGAQTFWNGSVEQTTTAGPGVENTDFVIYITAAQLSNYCGNANGGTVAFALTCQRDQFDRPTFGRANFCPARLSAWSQDWGVQFGVAVHELLHALGFSADSWLLFRDADNPDLAPRTPRNPGFPFVPADQFLKTYTCPGYSGQRRRYVASNSTIGYESERGMNCSSADDVAAHGIDACVGRIVTPRVRAAARDHFGCSDLAGAELENQDTTPCALQGSHWEQRVFNGEVMTPFLTHTSFVSKVTLATLEDSGWYQANYSAADAFTEGVDFAYRQGCALARDNKCLTPGSPPAPNAGTRPHYCTTNGVVDCTFDNRAVGRCYTASLSVSIPPHMQYWSDDARFGGYAPMQSDFCPIVQAYSNRICSVPEHLPANSHVFAYQYGNSSMCLRSTLFDANYFVMNPATAGCFQFRCVPADENNPRLHLDIVIPRVGGGTPWLLPCVSGTELHTVSGYGGAIQCVDPRAFCGGLSPPPSQPETSANSICSDRGVLLVQREGNVSFSSSTDAPSEPALGRSCLWVLRRSEHASPLSVSIQLTASAPSSRSSFANALLVDQSQSILVSSDSNQSVCTTSEEVRVLLAFDPADDGVQFQMHWSEANCSSIANSTTIEECSEQPPSPNAAVISIASGAVLVSKTCVNVSVDVDLDGVGDEPCQHLPLRINDDVFFIVRLLTGARGDPFFGKCGATGPSAPVLEMSWTELVQAARAGGQLPLRRRN